MGNRDLIIGRVLGVVDEVGNGVDATVVNNYPVSSILDQAGRELLMIAPLALLSNVKSFVEAPLLARADGTGEVELPSDFVRLVRFRMKDWARSVYEPIATTSAKYARQFHRTTRGGPSQPVVAICGNHIQYFSVRIDATHVVEIADYIHFDQVDDHYPTKLNDALVWLTAASLLKVMSEFDVAKMAMEEYERLISNLFSVYGK